MADNTITSADAEFFITVQDLYSAPQRLQGFMADRMFQTDAVDVGEFVMGADGNLSAGWIPNPRMQAISIMPDSPSNTIFEQIDAVETQGRRKLQLGGVIILPALRKKYTLIKGYLRNYVPIVGAAKVLEGRPFGIIWTATAVMPI